MKITERSTCRVSGGELIEVFDLGNLPNSCFPLPSDPDPEKTPLVLCLNKESGLVQLKHTVDPDVMYSHYWYFSGINKSMNDALESIVKEALERISLNPGDIVVDIASNDGTLLSKYPEYLFRVGIDPAKNIKPKNCNLHINTYFSSDVYKEHLGDKKAKVVTSICVLYDLEDPIKFCKGVKEILDEDGLWIAEMSYLPTMLEENSFETVVAEHIEYYSIESMDYILEKAGMAIEDIDFNDVNGGSFRLYIRHKGKEQPTETLLLSRNREKFLGLKDVNTYKSFADRVNKNKEECINHLKRLKSEGKLVLGYGASTKGNTIMSYYGIGPDLIPFVADRNPEKWGRETVTRIPIISEDDARAMNPDYFFVFPYHFFDEFVKREIEFLTRGGSFIIPIPYFIIFKGFDKALD